MLKECKFCGQMVDVGETNVEGYYYCACGGARAEVHIQEQIEEACENIDVLFGEDCGEYGFAPVKNGATVDTMKTLSALVARGELGAASLKISGGGVAVISIGNKGEVKITRKVTKAQELKATMIN